MPTLADPTDGRTVTVDLASGTRVDPADLPAHTVQEGLPVTWRRTPGPVEVDVEVLLSDIPGVGEPRQDVIDWLDEAARSGRRLTLVVDGLPTTAGLMVGTRTYTTSPGSTTTRLRVSLREVRVVRQARASIAFPTPRPDMRSGRTSTQDQGEAATKPADAATQERWVSILKGAVGT